MTFKRTIVVPPQGVKTVSDVFESRGNPWGVTHRQQTQLRSRGAVLDFPEDVDERVFRSIKGFERRLSIRGKERIDTCMSKSRKPKPPPEPDEHRRRVNIVRALKARNYEPINDVTYKDGRFVIKED